MRLLLLLLLFPFVALAQCYNRYSEEIFSTVQVNTIAYGENINYKGDTVQLYLDYYTATTDSNSHRPLIILLHGTDFVSGSKTDIDLVTLSNKLAHRGFAVANIDYRKTFSLQTLLDKNSLFNTALNAAHDAKAAVRFFRNSYNIGNNYKIDSSMIWLGGIGSGAMAAQLAVYLDDSLEVHPAWRSIIQSAGGLEGNSGTPNISSKVKGVISLSGATLDTTWMNNNTEPLISIHGDVDNYYPYTADSLFSYTHNRTCNLRHELCYKRLNEVTFVQTHNSHAHDGNFSVLAANQNGDIPAQLAAGVRALGIKLYYTSSFFCSGGTDLYAYHGNPVFGCVKFSTIGAQIKSFLDNNPNEFLFVTVEGSASNTEIANGFNSAGLSPFLYQHSFGNVWPTIGELIDSGKRLIVMTNNAGPSLPGYHHMWTFIQDTEYDFQSTGAFNCNHLRGNTDADLFLLNHFLTIGSPQPLSANNTNDWQLVLNRARQCGAARGLHPNLLYIDFYDSGDVFRAADSLNRIGEDFPFVYGSSAIQQHAQQQNILAELYTINGQGYSPYASNFADSTAAFIADFMLRHYPCQLSCAAPIQEIIGQDSIAKDSSHQYSIAANLGANYQWILGDSVYNNLNTIYLTISDSNTVLLLKVVETSQYGCSYDTISLAINIYEAVSTQKIENNTVVNIYPNPVQDQLLIEIKEKTLNPFLSIQVYNSQGQLVLQQQHENTSTTRLNVQNLAKGLYLLKIRTHKTYNSLFIKH